MKSKEALYKLEKNTNWSSDENIDKDLYNLWGNVACRAIKKDLERLESLEKQNELLKKDLKEYQAYIKKGVEEHYKDFMSDYDLLLQECQELYKKLEVLEIIKKSITDKYLLCKRTKCLNSLIIGLHISEDTDFKKIKEWLEDE